MNKSVKVLIVSLLIISMGIVLYEISLEKNKKDEPVIIETNNTNNIVEENSNEIIDQEPLEKEETAKEKKVEKNVQKEEQKKENKTEDVQKSEEKVLKENSSSMSSNGHKIETIDGVTYVDGYLIVNKTYPLPKDYYPQNTHETTYSSTDFCRNCIIEEAYQAFVNMKNDAQGLGLNLWIQSGYRSYNLQKGLYNGYVNSSGKASADTYSARPGHSEHQTGYAFDLNTIKDSFADTSEGIWVNENCYNYGFVIRYPKGKSGETGYKYEPWHLRYVGKDLAAVLYNSGDWITMESYFGITSEYSY